MSVCVAFIIGLIITASISTKPKTPSMPMQISGTVQMVSQEIVIQLFEENARKQAIREFENYQKKIEGINEELLSMGFTGEYLAQ